MQKIIVDLIVDCIHPKVNCHAVGGPPPQVVRLDQVKLPQMVALCHKWSPLYPLPQVVSTLPPLPRVVPFPSSLCAKLTVMLQVQYLPPEFVTISNQSIIQCF